MAIPADKAHVSAFRTWLVDRVKESGWVAYAGESAEAVSKRLGLRPEILREAQAALTEECRRQAQEPQLVGSRRIGTSGRKRVDIVLPKLVHEHWVEYCEARDLAPAVVLRSLIHHVLSRPTQPKRLGTRWFYRGRYRPLCLERGGKRGRGRFITSVVTDVSRASYEALVVRARNARVDPPMIIRGAMIDLLEGRITNVQVVSRWQQMWGDRARYWTRGREDHG